MSMLLRLLLVALVLAAGVWALLFSLANTSPVSLDLVFVVLPETSMSVWVIGAFVAGGLCGLAAASTAIWRARLTVLALRRELKKISAVPGQQRASPAR
jgi:putative membrane protein